MGLLLVVGWIIWASRDGLLKPKLFDWVWLVYCVVLATAMYGVDVDGWWDPPADPPLLFSSLVSCCSSFLSVGCCSSGAEVVACAVGWLWFRVLNCWTIFWIL